MPDIVWFALIGFIVIICAIWTDHDMGENK